MHKHTFYKINDTLDISLLKNEEERAKIRHTYIISDNKEEEKEIKDSKHSSIIKDGDYKNIIYVLATTSDKVINRRKYDDNSVKDLSNKNGWFKPYNKPVLKNHDSLKGEPVGRVLKSYIVEHSTKRSYDSRNKELDSEVFNFFDSNDCFKTGESSLILKCFVNDEIMAKIKDGYYLTVSQGISCTDIICNVCEKSYFECPHIPGETYTVDNKEVECIPVATGIFTADEVSIVNVPANDTSIIYFKDEEQENNVADSKNENTIKDNQKEKIKDNQNIDEFDKKNIACKDNTNNEIVNKDKKGGFKMSIKDLLKQSLLKDIKNVWDLKDEKEESIKTFFDSLEEDKIEKFIQVINDLQEATTTSKVEKETVEEEKVADTKVTNNEEEKTVPVEPELNKVNDNKENVNDNKEQTIPSTLR